MRLRRSHLDLSALDAHLERGLRRGRRPLHNRSVEAEGTAVAGTDDCVVFQLALVQRAAAVRATVDEPVETPFFAHQQHSDTVSLCASQPSFLELILAEDRSPLVWRVLLPRLGLSASPRDG